VNLPWYFKPFFVMSSVQGLSEKLPQIAVFRMEAKLNIRRILSFLSFVNYGIISPEVV